MHTIDRRSFLALLGAASLFPSVAFAKARRTQPRAGETLLALFMPEGEPNFHLATLDSATGKWNSYPLPLPRGLDGAHSVEVNHHDPAQLVIFPRKLPKAVLFSLREKKVTKEIQARDGHIFTGHGLFAPNGKHFLASEIKNDGSCEGFISIRDHLTGEIVDEIHTGAKQPHQLIAADPELKTLGITHYGDEFGQEPKDLKSEITFLDFKSKRVLQRISKTTHVNAELCHFVQNPNNPDEFFVSAHDHVLTAPKSKSENINDMVKYFPAPVYWTTRSEGKLREFDPEGNTNLFEFNFSVAISGKHKTFALIHVNSERVSFWDTKAKKLRKIIKFPRSEQGFLSGIGATHSENEFFISASYNQSHKSKLIFLDAESLDVTREFETPVPGKFGAHLNRTPFRA